jgi:hypothetical protein
MAVELAPLHSVWLLMGFTVGTGFTVIAMALLVAEFDVWHWLLAVSTQVITSASLMLVYPTNVLVDCMLMLLPFTLKLYEGTVPPFTAVAVKVMGVPAHSVVCDAVSVMAGVTTGISFTTMALEVSATPALDDSIL